MNVFSLDQIEREETSRISTGFVMLDVMLGKSGEGEAATYGAVRGSQILLAGAAGCGKSRLCIDIASHINFTGLKILYFQLEANLSDFKVWAKDKITKTDTFFVSQERDYKEQANIIKQLKPDIVFIDSVNKYDVHHSQVGEVVDTLQEAAREVNCVNFLIGQLDVKSSQMQVRGSQDWVFLPDVILHAYKYQPSFKEHKEAMMDEAKRELLHLSQSGVISPTMNAAQRNALDIAIKDSYENKKMETRGQFVVSIPEKNRYGSVGQETFFQHDEDGVFEL